MVHEALDPLTAAEAQAVNDVVGALNNSDDGVLD